MNQFTSEVSPIAENTWLSHKIARDLVSLERDPDLPASARQFIEVLREEARDFLIIEKQAGRSKLQ